MSRSKKDQSGATGVKKNNTKHEGSLERVKKSVATKQTKSNVGENELNPDNINDIIKTIRLKIKAFEAAIVQDLNKIKKMYTQKGKVDKRSAGNVRNVDLKGDSKSKREPVDKNTKTIGKRSKIKESEKPSTRNVLKEMKDERTGISSVLPIGNKDSFQIQRQDDTVGADSNKDKKARKTKKRNKTEQKENKFRFLVFFGKKDDEVSINDKCRKIADFMNVFLSRRVELSSSDNKIDVENEIKRKPAITLSYGINVADKEAEYIFTCQEVDEIKTGEIIETINVRFYKAVEKKLCKDFVYVFDKRVSDNTNVLSV